HYSTAADLARLAAYAMKNPVFREIVSTKVKTVPWPGEKWHRKWYNKNKMLRFYRWADGVKTGYTKKAGRTLVSSATRDGRRRMTGMIPCVCLSSDSKRSPPFGWWKRGKPSITPARRMRRVACFRRRRQRISSIR